MSVLSDLFEGNFSNIGTDFADAPSSAVQDYRSEWVPAAAVGGTLLTAGLLGPELLGGAAAADAAGLGTDAAAGGLAAASDPAAFGAFDPALFAANTAATDILPGGVDLGTAAATGGATDLLAGAGGEAALAGDPALTGDAALAFADSPAAPFLPGDPVSGLATDASGAIAQDFPQAIGAGGGGSLYGSPVDAEGFLTQDSGALPFNTTDATQGLATTDQAATGTAPTTQSLVNQAAGSMPSGAASDVLGTSAESTVGPPVTAANQNSGLFGTGISGGQALIAGAAVAPLALALARGEAQLPSSAVQAQQNAAVLSQFGQQNINGQLNAGQLATLQVMQQNLTNQWKQTLYNQGVQDLTKDARWPQIQAQIDTQVTAATSQMITSNINQALTALGSAGTQLNQIAQMQMTADSNFTNTLVNATKSLGLLAGTNFTGGVTKAAA